MSGCATPTPAGALNCRDHWAEVPAELKKRFHQAVGTNARAAAIRAIVEWFEAPAAEFADEDGEESA